MARVQSEGSHSTSEQEEQEGHNEVHSGARKGTTVQEQRQSGPLKGDADGQKEDAGKKRQELEGVKQSQERRESRWRGRIRSRRRGSRSKEEVEAVARILLSLSRPPLMVGSENKAKQ
ncbi:unnamed protein product [Discosporangium mesarthrocarpum]